MSPVKSSPDPLWLLEARALGIPARLSPLDLAWAGGQLVALLGPNGSGKSTLLGALAGILPADGAVLLGGEVLTDLSWPELARRRAMLPQRQPQLFHIPVFQVLSLGLDEEGLPEAQGRAVAEICAALELDALLARDFSRLSGGEQQRVLIARTLLQLWPGLNTDGRVLLLDEPTNDIDVNTLRALEEGLEDFAGCAVVISHDRWFLDRICTHILAFEGDSNVFFFEGSYSEYEENKQKRLGKEEPTRVRYRKLMND